MAFAQLTSERLRSGTASLGAVHGCGAVHDGWGPDSRPQVHPELVQRVPEQPVRRSAVCDADGRYALCGAAFGDIYEGAQNPSGVYV